MIAAFAWLGSRAARLRQARGASAATYWLLAALFALEMPTTGFFEAAFLFDASVCPRRSSPIAPRSRRLRRSSAPRRGPPRASRAGRRAVALRSVRGDRARGARGYAWYPWSASPAYFLATAALAGVGSGGLTVLLCVAIVHDADRIPMLAALPSMAIMIGTEFGLELLQLVLAGAHADRACHGRRVQRALFRAGRLRRRRSGAFVGRAASAVRLTHARRVARDRSRSLAACTDPAAGAAGGGGGGWRGRIACGPAGA